MWSVIPLTLASLAVAAQGPGATFPFPGGELRIDVTAETALRVEVEDGRPGQVRIQDLTPDPRAAYSLGDSRLVVSHRSRSPGHYRVEVPAEARVTLRVNDAEVAALAASTASRRLVWFSSAAEGLPGRARPPAKAAYAEPEPPAPTRSEFWIDAFRGPLVVDSIDIAHPERARVLRIRLSRRNFRVSGDRALGFAFHGPTRWGVLTVRDTAAIVELELPAEARRFLLRVAGRAIWLLHSAGARALCEPVARVRRPDGGEDWVFHLESELVCREEPQGARPA